MPLPKYPELEAIVLSNCFYYDSNATEVLAGLKTEDFSEPVHAIVFKHIEERARMGLKIDYTNALVSFSSSLNKEQIEAFLKLRTACDRNAPVSDYISKIKEASELKRLYFLTWQAYSDIDKGLVTPEQVRDRLLQCVDSLTGGNTGGRYIEDVIEDFEGRNLLDVVRERMEKFQNGEPLYSGVRSGYPLLDKSIGSFRNGTLTYIGARTNTGKTTFIMNIMSQILFKSKHRMCFFSAEMPDESILEKFLCMDAAISYQKYSEGRLTVHEFWSIEQRIKAISGPENSRRFIINDGPLTTSSLSSKMRRYVKIDGIEIFFIDYLTLIKSMGKHNNGHEKVNEISKELQRLAKELKVPIVCLAQLNRGAAAKPPTLSDFRESGSIEEDCDVAIMLYQPSLYDPNVDKNLHLTVAKNRLMGTLCKIEYARDDSAPGKWIELDSLESVTSAIINSPPEDKFSQNYGYSP